MSSVLKPNELALEVCKSLNQETINYINGAEQVNSLYWLPNKHENQTLSVGYERAIYNFSSSFNDF